MQTPNNEVVLDENNPLIRPTRLFDGDIGLSGSTSPTWGLWLSYDLPLFISNCVQAGWYFILGQCCEKWYDRYKSIPALERAIKYYNHILVLVPEGRRDRPAFLDATGAAYFKKYQLLGREEDIRKAFDLHADATTQPRIQPNVAISILYHLANDYLELYRLTGQVDDLERSTDNLRKVLMIISETHPKYKFLALGKLAQIYSVRYERFFDTTDFEGFLSCSDQALELSFRYPKYFREHYVFTHTLISIIHGIRYRRFGDISDLKWAMKNQYRFVCSVPRHDPNRHVAICALGTIHASMFEQTAQAEELQKSIYFHTRAMRLLLDDDPQKPHYLFQLAFVHLRRFELLGDISDIDTSIAYLLEGESSRPAGDIINRPFLLDGLGFALATRYDRLNDLADLDQAINYCRDADSLLHYGSFTKIGCLDHLGSAYRRKFNRLGYLPDLEAAIAHHTNALSLMPRENVMRPVCLGNVADAHFLKSMRLDDVQSLKTALEYQRQAVSALPDGSVFRMIALNSLGIMHERLFASSKQLSDIEASISYLNQALSLSGNDHPFRARVFFHLAMSHCARLACSVARPDREPVPDLYSFDNILQIGDVILEAAAVAIEHQEHILAFEWLEEGRAIVWKQILQLRTPLEELSLVDNKLATKIKNIARSLELAGQSQYSHLDYSRISITQEQESRVHRQLAAQWEELLKQARSIPGFENFLLPLKFCDLVKAARSHTVVIINVHSRHCDALIIRPGSDQILHTPLPNFSHAKALELSSRMAASLNHSKSRSAKRRPVFVEEHHVDHFASILTALWADIVEPVLEGCGFLAESPSGNLPRITWCTTGPLAFLPLHAAGDYTHSEARIFNYVISSYTPSIGALLKSTPNATKPVKLLAIGQANTPGQETLPGTVKELDEIKRLSDPANLTILEGHDATPEATLNAMKIHDWVHLACHASQCAEGPTKSAFQLHGGTLDLATIMKQSFDTRGLAFLSACQTAQGDERLAEETVHLAAGMLVSGYSTVVATMWSVEDSDAPMIAGKVYAHLIQGGKMECGNTATALHDAVKDLRHTVGEDQFVRWAPFIHIGI
ncbi:CHAT domain protein [Ceratobasidium sp. AG-Ba]|nr:CHAT domain protein [Ceratobasidium sp. AG-Ba]